MVVPAGVDPRIEIDLTAVRVALADLPLQLQEWSHASEVVLASWQIEWWDMMGRLQALGRALRLGHLNAEQEARYRLLMGDLLAAMPLVKQLDFEIPQTVLQDLSTVGEAILTV